MTTRLLHTTSLNVTDLLPTSLYSLQRERVPVPVYTLKLRVPMRGMDHVKVCVLDHFHVGQTVTIAPQEPLVLQGTTRSVTIRPGDSISGTITSHSWTHD